MIIKYYYNSKMKDLSKYVVKNIIKLLKDIKKTNNIEKSLQQNLLFTTISSKNSVKSARRAKSITGGFNFEFLNEEFHNLILRLVIHLNNDNNQLLSRYYQTIDNYRMNNTVSNLTEQSQISLNIVIFFMSILFIIPLLNNSRINSSINTPIVRQNSNINPPIVIENSNINIPIVRQNNTEIVSNKLFYITQEEIENIYTIDPNPTCFICTKNYNKTQNKQCVLKPCNHTVCKKCLEDNCKTPRCFDCPWCRGKIRYVIEIKNQTKIQSV